MQPGHGRRRHSRAGNEEARAQDIHDIKNDVGTCKTIMFMPLGLRCRVQDGLSVGWGGQGDREES